MVVHQSTQMVMFRANLSLKPDYLSKTSIMKKLMSLVLAIGLFLNLYSQKDCYNNAIAYGLAANIHINQYPGISVEGVYLAQVSKIGGSIGFGFNPIKYKEVYYLYKDGITTRETREVKNVNAQIWADILFKLYQVDFKYSVHILTGVTMDLHYNSYYHFGFNLRLPNNLKAFYIQPQYNTNKTGLLRLGVYLQ